MAEKSQKFKVLYCIFLVEHSYCEALSDNIYICFIMISLHWYDI